MPTELLTAFVSMPVAVLCATTFTARIASPFGSVTAPVSTASAPCPKTEILSNRRSGAVAKSLNGITDLLEILDGAVSFCARRLAEGDRLLKGAAIYRCSTLSVVLLRYPSKADEVSVQRNMERY